MIPVTKPYLPSREKLEKYIGQIYDNGWLTNNGPLVKELTSRLKDYLGVENLLLVGNGTIALQVAYHALGVARDEDEEKSEAITTPFTFIATASSLKLVGLDPVFVDINPSSWCISSRGIKRVISSKTKAIVPVHVFGNICEVEEIDQIAKESELKVIYDASHAFGVNYSGGNIFEYGDASTLSFHATKLFHTIEGGAIIFKNKEDMDRAQRIINFGFDERNQILELGMNGKMNEFEAAMGLCVLDEFDENIRARKKIAQTYMNGLKDCLEFQLQKDEVENNSSYFPVLFKTEQELLKVHQVLKEQGVFCRRYFFPSLDSVGFFNSKKTCDVSRDVSQRVLCLPVFFDLEELEQNKIIQIIKDALVGC